MNSKYHQTEEAIFNSMILFLNNHEKDELTIKELCHMAKISRTTFYSHFMTLNEAFIALKKHYIGKDFIETNELLTKESRRLILQYLKDNACFFYIYPKLIEKDEISSIYGIVKNKIKEYPGFPVDSKKLLFLTSGYISSIFHAMSRCFSFPLHDMEDYFDYFVSLLS